MSSVGLVVVSHSRALAEAAVALAAEMAQAAEPPRIAAGLDDGALGTDAAAILEAVVDADRGDGVVVLMDLGSAVLSAELALELLDDEQRERVLLTPAPLVEGLVAAVVAAAGGADRQEVAAQALAGLAGKQAHLSGPDVGPPAADPASGVADAQRSVVVRDPHGLHARPATRLVREAARWPARVELRNATTGSSWVSGSSLSAVTVLGVLTGHELQLRADGPDAGAALEALVAAVDGPGPATAEPPAPVPQSGGGAVACSPGIVVGPAAPRRAHTSRPDTAAGDPRQELDRLRAARSAARGQVQRIRDATAAELGEQEAAVFDAHLLLVDDEDLVVDAERRVAGGEPAAAAWQSAVTRVEASFAGLPDPYLRARAADVRAVGDQVLGALSGDEQELDPVGVLVADDLTPAQAAGLDPARTVGVVLAAGSPTAHSAILLRARGVPAVVGAGPAVLDVSAETLVALDGSTGELHLHPDEATRAAFAARAAAEAGARRAALGQAATPARTRDGVDVLVGANLGSLDDARRAADSGADLAGLVRTEFLFLDRDAAPGVEEQEAAYLELAEALGGRRLTLRTLDVGGDKPLRYLPGPVEANPFLGVRGLRLSLARPGLLADQLLAVVRAAHRTPVSVMFPMVSTLAELTAARQVLTDAVARDGRPPPADLQVGMMVEVPAAALKTAAFAPHVDFFSIGTNDLTQYALAAERGAPALTELADAYDPGVLALVAAVCRGAGQALVAVCGELAADPRATGLLVGLGVRELSAAPAAVPAVKQAVRALDTGEAAGAAAAALVAPDAAAVRALRAAGPPASP